jgi:hypothetical protein
MAVQSPLVVTPQCHCGPIADYRKVRDHEVTANSFSSANPGTR